MKIKKICFVVVLFLAGCSDSDNDTYTLYRNSELAGFPRMHVSTFDSMEGEKFNRVNCQIAADLFQGQPFVVVKYWCEKGKYKK